MKNILTILFVSLFSAFTTLWVYKTYFDENETTKSEQGKNTGPVMPTAFYKATNPQPVSQPISQPVSQPVVIQNQSKKGDINIDFTKAAEKTVDAVVHIKHYGVSRQPTNLMDFFRRGGVEKKVIQGTGSGVIITADGYIVTNNHVIIGAEDLVVTLNNNQSFKATVVGTSPQNDIALLKIKASDKLAYIPFGDSNSAKIGEWVLAVGNPFNLTSTVTAGIISAKSRDIDETDEKIQSFIQTDAAINPGNSGGALVNLKGELIGINTAITSQTGSYVGYAFAVPSNNARKIVEDILEYGTVQRAIIGITGGTVNPKLAKEYEITASQGVIVSTVTDNSGAQKAGIQKGDVITQIDGLKIKKFSDLTGYINSKSPSDVIQITVLRNKQTLQLPVTLSKYTMEQYVMRDIGIEVSNTTKSYLKKFNLDHGVVISKALTMRMKQYDLEGLVIVAIDKKKISTVAEVKKIIENKYQNEDIIISLINRNGEKREFVFQ